MTWKQLKTNLRSMSNSTIRLFTSTGWRKFPLGSRVGQASCLPSLSLAGPSTETVWYFLPSSTRNKISLRRPGALRSTASGPIPVWGQAFQPVISQRCCHAMP